jgi:UDP-N-acetylmuramate dehydrogenase
VSPGLVKTAAAWLIEHAGFLKGYSLGPAGLSTKHTLALVNKGGAKAEDVVRLAREIRARVLDRFGIELQPEPVFLGFSDGVFS